VDSAMIGKIEKAKRYAEEPERIRITQMTVDFTGDHNSYVVSFEQGKWNCGCRFFAQRGVCSHTMTMERLFGEQLVSAGPDEEAES